MKKILFGWLLLLFFVTGALAGPHGDAASTQNSVVGAWKVLMRGISDFSSNISKIDNPNDEFYVFNTEGDGYFVADRKKTKFNWKNDLNTLTITYTDGYKEIYDGLIFSNVNGQKTVGMIGTFDYFDNGASVTVSISLMH